jgi:hypothetical protein
MLEQSLSLVQQFQNNFSDLNSPNGSGSVVNQPGSLMSMQGSRPASAKKKKKGGSNKGGGASKDARSQ